MEVPSQWEVDELTERVRVLEGIVDILVRKGLIKVQYAIKVFGVKEIFNTKEEAWNRIVELQGGTNKRYEIERVYSE